MKISKKIAWALGFYITALIASNTLGIKLMPLPWGMHLSVAIFTFPFVFLTTVSSDFHFSASYEEVFGLLLRFTIASLAAFIVGEYQDVLAFFFFKKFSRDKKFFWLRSNLSNNEVSK